MTGAELRASILQAAVQGKLVPQDPTDEPASVLLERIREERRALVKAKKAKAPKGGESIITRYSDGTVWETRGKGKPVVITDEVPFDIPEGWEWARFESVAIIASNLVSPKDYGDSPHIAPDNIEKWSGTLLPYRTVADDKVRSNNHHFFAGQVLYSKIRPALRKATIAPCEGLCSADMYPLDSLVEPRYLLTYLLSDCFTEQILRTQTRVKMPKTNQNDLNMVFVPVPPLAEQQRIVAKLDELMPLVERYARLDRERTELNAGIEGAMRASVLQAAVQGQLTEREGRDEPASELLERIREERRALVKAKKAKAPKGGESRIWRANDGAVWEQRGKGKAVDITDEIPFDIPEGWEWARLTSVCGHIVDGDHNPPSNSGSGVPILSAANVHDNALHPEEANRWVTYEQYEKAFERIRPSVGCVLMTIVGTIGRTAVLCDEEPFALQRSVAVLRPLQVDPWYVATYLSSQSQYLNSISAGTAQKGVYLGTVGSLLIPVPPLAEQRRIVARLDEMLPKVERLGGLAS